MSKDFNTYLMKIFSEQKKSRKLKYRFFGVETGKIQTFVRFVGSSNQFLWKVSKYSLNPRRKRSASIIIRHNLELSLGICSCSSTKEAPMSNTWSVFNQCQQSVTITCKHKDDCNGANLSNLY